MKKRFNTKTAKTRFSLIASAIIVLTIPLVVFGLVKIENFDIRDWASSPETVNGNCNISFIYVNPQTLQVGKTVQMQVTGNVESQKVQKITVLSGAGYVIFEKVYSPEADQINEKFTFTPDATGQQVITGVLKTPTKSYTCSLNSQGGKLTALTENQAPQFKTNPFQNAKPSNAIKVKDSYTYELVAEDPEKDPIRYAYSFTPRTNWMDVTVVSDGSNGVLKLQFKGVADYPASYLANVLIYDGYNSHVRSQAWVISADPDSNDTPQVQVILPSDGRIITPGEILEIKWRSFDRNQIVRYKLYYAENISDEKTWKPIDLDVQYNVERYLFNTKDVKPGKYYIVVQAVDNVNPPATGTGYSGMVNVNQEEKPGPDDGNQLEDPQIINVYPANNAKIKNAKTTVSATLIASRGSKVSKETISLKMDNVDVTKNLKINEVTDSEFSIIYTPKDNLNTGVHRVAAYFKDSSGKDIEKKWTFTIEKSDEKDSDTIKIFGIEISKKTAIIIGIGLGILILAFLVPWLLYLAWKNSDQEEYETSTLPPSTPDGKNVSSDTYIFTGSEPITDNAIVPVENNYDYTPKYQPESSPIQYGNISGLTPVVAPLPEDTSTNQNQTVQFQPDQNQPIQTEQVETQTYKPEQVSYENTPVIAAEDDNKPATTIPDDGSNHAQNTYLDPILEDLYKNDTYTNSYQPQKNDSAQDLPGSQNPVNNFETQTVSYQPVTEQIPVEQTPEIANIVEEKPSAPVQNPLNISTKAPTSEPVEFVKPVESDVLVSSDTADQTHPQDVYPQIEQSKPLENQQIVEETPVAEKGEESIEVPPQIPQTQVPQTIETVSYNPYENQVANTQTSSDNNNADTDLDEAIYGESFSGIDDLARRINGEDPDNKGREKLFEDINGYGVEDNNLPLENPIQDIENKPQDDYNQTVNSNSFYTNNFSQNFQPAVPDNTNTATKPEDQSNGNQLKGVTFTAPPPSRDEPK